MKKDKQLLRTAFQRIGMPEFEGSLEVSTKMFASIGTGEFRESLDIHREHCPLVEWLANREFAAARGARGEELLRIQHMSVIVLALLDYAYDYWDLDESYDLWSEDGTSADQN